MVVDLMIGRLFDDGGNRMGPSHARKGHVKYRYYLPAALLQGTALHHLGTDHCAADRRRAECSMGGTIGSELGSPAVALDQCVGCPSPIVRCDH